MKTKITDLGSLYPDQKREGEVKWHVKGRFQFSGDSAHLALWALDRSEVTWWARVHGFDTATVRIVACL